MKKSRISGATLAAIVLLAAASIPQAAPLADAFTLTVYEQTGSIDAYTFQSSDPLLYAKRTGYPGPPGWGGNGYDFGTGGCEYYDLFFSDSLGNVLALSPGDALPAPAYLTIVCMDLNCNDGSITPAPSWVGAGNNIDAVKITYGGTTYWANGVLQATYGLCDEPFSAKTSNFADAALGPQDAGITKMGCGPSALTLRFSPVPPPPTLTVYEQTGSINAYTFQSTDPLLYAKRTGYPGPPGWGGNGYDFGTGGCEYYDLFFSDSLGNVLALSPGDPLPAPAYLTILCMDLNCNDGSITPAPTWVGAGNNIDAVKINYGGTDYWANAVLQATYGLCDEPFSAKTSNFADAALGPQDAGITKMGCGPSTLTLRLGDPGPALPDTTPPYLASIQALGKTLIGVMFNESVLQTTAETPGNYEIYLMSDTLLANPLPVSAAVLQSDRRYVQLTLGMDLAFDTTYVLRVNDIEDLHGNRMVHPDAKEFIRPDIYPPVPLTAFALTRSLIKVTFDERLDETTAETVTNYEVYETLNTSHTDAVTGAELDVGGTVVQLNLVSPIHCDTTYTIRISRVKDLKGNAISRVTITTAYPDTIPPVFAGVTPMSERCLELAFDEKLSEGPAETVSNYTLFETDHPSNVIGISSATLTGDGSRVQLVLSTNLVSGRSYTISVSNLADIRDNIISAGTSRVFIYTDAVPPALLSAHAAVSMSVLAGFSERIDNVSAESAGNYLVFETANPAVTIPVSVAALSGDSSNVLLTLGSALENGVAYSLKATGVADRAGNPVPAGSVVPITRPDMTPPHLSAAEAVSLTYVSVTFDEPVTGATAGLAANYVLIPADDPGSTFSPSSVDLPDSRTAGLRFGASLGSGATYTVRVSNVADTAGNVIAPGSEKTFVCPSIPSGSGYIGLFVDADHSDITVDYASASAPFNVYVWSHPGSAGMMAAEFSVAFPSNVIFAGYTMNPLVAVFLGDITQDLSVAYSECQREWTWILKADCYLMNDDKTLIGFGPGPIFANCSVGYPIESANVLGRIYCNGGVATLLQEAAASCVGGAVEVTWRLSRMDENVQFRVLRKEEGGAAYGAPSENVESDGLSFTYRDESAEPGTTYRYRVEYVDGSGVHILFETDPVAVPALRLALRQNSPNPFNPSTTISYYLPERMRVRLDVYDVSGRLVARLVDEEQQLGDKAVQWDGRGMHGERVSSGVYYYRLQAGKEVISRKMVLLR